jgi:hypothetical protein
MPFELRYFVACRGLEREQDGSYTARSIIDSFELSAGTPLDFYVAVSGRWIALEAEGARRPKSTTLDLEAWFQGTRKAETRQRLEHVGLSLFFPWQPIPTTHAFRFPMATVECDGELTLQLVQIEPDPADVSASAKLVGQFAFEVRVK